SPKKGKALAAGCEALAAALGGTPGSAPEVTLAVFPDAGTFGTFINLGDNAPGTVAGLVEYGDEGYSLGGDPLNGSYDFVIQNQQMRIGSGHVALSGGDPVQWAGEIIFED